MLHILKFLKRKSDAFRGVINTFFQTHTMRYFARSHVPNCNICLQFIRAISPKLTVHLVHFDTLTLWLFQTFI